MQETADLVTFNEEILNEKLHFLWLHACSGSELISTVTSEPNNPGA